MNYIDLYNKRVGISEGEGLKERINRGREANFERFLKASPHYEKVKYNEKELECVLEPSSQDNTKTLMHLLCRVKDELKAGSIIETGKDKFMLFFHEHRQDSGYNRWTILRLNHHITWYTKDGKQHSSYVYLHGQRESALEGTIKSRSREATLFMENMKLETIIMPINKDIEIDAYFTLSIEGLSRNYRVVGYDFTSTEGVMYISVDPTIKRDLTPAPEKKEEDKAEDFFWLGGVDEE